jgi:two-component system, chemotaxis family, chemotaxis protein CheY
MPVAITKADFSRLNILVIDDSQFVCRLVEEILTSFGVGKVSTVESAQKAFVEMQNNCPDLVICDWQMYPEDGLSVLRKLRQELATRYPRMPFIMLTGHSGPDDVSAAIGEGANSYIVKPFSAQTLMKHLLKVIVADNDHINNQETWAI